MRVPYLWNRRARKWSQSRKLKVERLEDRLALATIQGTLWHDLNQDGVRETGEPLLVGRSVYLDTNGNGVFDSGESSQTTGASGEYSFAGLPAGDYAVGVVGQAGWVQTSPRFTPLAPGNLTPATWQLRGPLGGDAVATAVSPLDSSLVLSALATDTYHGGLFRSSDGGATWVELPEFVERPVLSVAIGTNGTMYAGTYNGLYRSTDSGVNWTKILVDSEANSIVYSIAPHPTDADTLLVGTNSRLTRDTVWKTTDGGATWTNQTPSQATGMTPSSIQFSPASADDVYLAFGRDFGPYGIFYSSDGGASWQDRRPGLPTGPIHDIAFAGNTVYIAGGAPFGQQHVGLYRSTDHGETWNSLSDSWATRFALSVAVDPTNPLNLVVGTEREGVYRSTDGGATWTFTAAGTGSTQIPDVVFTSGGVVAASSAFAILRSTDGGTSFGPSAAGIAEFDAQSVAVNPLNPNELALTSSALNIGLLMTSLDGGATWQIENTPGPTKWSLVQFAPDGRLYAVGDGTTSTPEGLYRRNADGTWTALGPSFFDYFDADVQTVLFSGSDPNLIFAAGQTSGSVPNVDERLRAAIWYSTDAGATWTRVWIGTDWGTTIRDLERTSDGTVLLATLADEANQSTMNSTVLRSTDGGQTWTPSTTGITGNFQANILAPSATNPNKVYLTNANSYFNGLVYVSSDAGLSWTEGITSEQSTGIYDLVVDSSDDRIVYATGAGFGNKVLRSQDSGLTFSSFEQGLNNAPALLYGQPSLSSVGGAAPKLLIATRGGVYATELYSTRMATQAVTLGAGDTALGVDFGQRALWGEVSGLVWEDENGDGVFGAEFARADWTVYLDANNNSELDPGERSYRTVGGGEYRFSGLKVGTYAVRLKMQTTWHQTFPLSNGGYSVTISAAGAVVEKNFGVQSDPTEVRGTKWNDLDGDGSRDVGEPGLAGWTIYLDLNANGQFDFGNEFHVSDVTDANGDYVIPVRVPETYIVGEKPPLYWVQTAPGDGNSNYDAGLGFGDPTGRPKWADHDVSTPNVIDIWYDFRDYNGYENQITLAQITAAEAAMDKWEMVTAGKLNFVRNTLAALADIIDIGTGDMAALGHTSGVGGVLGAASSAAGPNNTLTSGIAWMDYADAWDTAVGNGDPAFTFDYYTVAGHEVGHALGLDHAEKLPWAWHVLMAPGYGGETVNFSTVDVDQIHALYGSGNDKGLGFHVVQISRGQIRDNLDFGSKLGAIPFSDFALDFGTATSPVGSGWTRATSATTFNPSVGGYGWTSGFVIDVDRGTADAQTRDFAQTTDATFVSDAPNGSYDVTVILGDPSKKRDQMEIYLEGTRVASVNTNAGAFSTQTFRVNVSDGQLTVHVRDAGGKDPQVALNALRVVKVQPLLTVTANPSAVSEAAGAGASTGTVARTGDLSQSITVALSSNDLSEATVPTTVTIAAGQSSATFSIAAVDDAIIDGTQNVIIAATATGYTSGSAALSVTDNDAPIFTAASFDFGTAGSPVGAGFTRVTATSNYTAAVGFGWLSGTIGQTDRGTSDPVTRDFNYTVDGTFVVNVVNGTYTVTVTMGDAAAARQKMAVYLEGTKVDTINTSAGQFVQRTYTVIVTDGQLTMRLDDAGGSDPYAIINGLQLSRNSGGPLMVAGPDTGPVTNRLPTPSEPLLPSPDNQSGDSVPPKLLAGQDPARRSFANLDPSQVDVALTGDWFGLIDVWTETTPPFARPKRR